MPTARSTRCPREGPGGDVAIDVRGRRAACRSPAAASIGSQRSGGEGGGHRRGHGGDRRLRGSGFYSLLEDVREVKVDTPYGAPSDSIFLADVAGRRVAFLPRHGRRHTIPPHQINYRANVWAMRSLGVKAAISPCAAGSLQLAVKPGDFVVCDQFVDRTNGRRTPSSTARS